MYHLVIPRHLCAETVTALLRQPDMTGLGLAGRNYTRTDMAFLCRDLALVPVTEPVPALPEDHVRLRLARTAAMLHDERWLGAPPVGQGQPGRAIVHLTLGVEAMRGQWTGMVVEAGGRRHPLRTVTLVGTEMATIHPTATGLLPASPADNGHPDRWSRTIGALGGTAIWQRLTTLRACIIGVSRTGSLIAASLAQMGVQTLTLIDPDVVEAHHLDAMDGITPDDLGRPKVAAVAAHLQRLCPASTFTVLPHRVTEHPALVRVKEADVLFCCVDNDAARLITTTLATLYLKPLIDVGTGIFFPPPTPPSLPRLGLLPRPHRGKWAATYAACSPATPVSCVPGAWYVKQKPAAPLPPGVRYAPPLSRCPGSSSALARCAP
jgi:hypothetical protein